MQAISFKNGSINLNSTNSSLKLINIEMNFNNDIDSKVLIIVDNQFQFEMQAGFFYQ